MSRAGAVDDVRHRGELYLLHQLHLNPGWVRHYAQRPPDELGQRGFERDERRHALQQFRGCIEALRAIGALGDGEAAAWLARFASAMDRGETQIPDLAPDGVSEERARRLLEGRLLQVREAVSDEDERAAICDFEDALTAVRVTGALTRAELRRWSTRLAEAASADGQRWLRSRDEPRSAWKGTELERVVAGPTERHAGVVITHAELHADALVLHCHRVATIELPQGRAPDRVEYDRAVRAALPSFGWPELDVGDDLGTRYRQVGGGEHLL